MFVARDLLVDLNAPFRKGEDDVIHATLSGHKPIVDQFTTKRRDIFVRFPQDGVDVFFRIGSFGLELTHQLLQNDHSFFSLRRDLLQPPHPRALTRVG